MNQRPCRAAALAQPWRGPSPLPCAQEPRGGGQEGLKKAMQEYYAAIQKGGGAIFFAVCRGKVRRAGGALAGACAGPALTASLGSQYRLATRPPSRQVSEGLDFADGNARGVIIVGIPFPAARDLKVPRGWQGGGVAAGAVPPGVGAAGQHPGASAPTPPPPPRGAAPCLMLTRRRSPRRRSSTTGGSAAWAWCRVTPGTRSRPSARSTRCAAGAAALDQGLPGGTGAAAG